MERVLHPEKEARRGSETPVQSFLYIGQDEQRWQSLIRHFPRGQWVKELGQLRCIRSGLENAPSVILLDVPYREQLLKEQLQALKKAKDWTRIPVFYHARHIQGTDLQGIRHYPQVSDVFSWDVDLHSIHERTRLFAQVQSAEENGREEMLVNEPVPLGYRPLFDMALGMTLLLCLSPWLLLISLMIRLESRGPAWVVQNRIGNGWKLFGCYHLRTRYWDGKEESGTLTNMGRALRYLRLIHLPQVLHVAKGEMSLLGRAPLSPEQAFAWAVQVQPQDLPAVGWINVQTQEEQLTRETSLITIHA